MKKKLLVTLMSALMLSTSLFGCSQNGNSGSTDTTAAGNTTAAATDATAAANTTAPPPSDTNKPVTLKMYLNGNSVTNDKAVMEKVNAYLKDKLNVTLEPIWGTWGDFDQNSVLAINGGDDVDIYFTCSWSADEYNAYAKKGAWVRLDNPDNNLIDKYAKDLWGTLPKVLVEGATIDGSDDKGVYAVPAYKDIATQNCWDINVPLLQKYGYTIDDIKKTDYYGFGEILKKVKEGEGDSFYPMIVEGAVLERMVDNISQVTGDAATNNVLSHYINPTDISKEGAYGNKVLSKFETPEYKKFVEKTREYFQAGYIDPAMGNADQANDARTAKQKSGQYLIGTQSYSYGYEAQASKERGFEVAYVPCTAPFVDTTSSQGALMAISTSSKNPDRAMEFLNLLNTDKTLMTLLAYGVEGTHYNLNDKGEAVFTDARKNEYMPWINGLGNVTLLPPQEGQGTDFQTKFKDFYSAAKQVPYLGYAFNAKPVETELAALANVAGEYALALNTGSVDPAEKLPEFIQKLKDSGIDKVVDEANKQLEEFMKNK